MILSNTFLKHSFRLYSSYSNWLWIAFNKKKTTTTTTIYLFTWINLYFVKVIFLFFAVFLWDTIIHLRNIRAHTSTQLRCQYGSWNSANLIVIYVTVRIKMFTGLLNFSVVQMLTFEKRMEFNWLTTSVGSNAQHKHTHQLLYIYTHKHNWQLYFYKCCYSFIHFTWNFWEIC